MAGRLGVAGHAGLLGALVSRADALRWKFEGAEALGTVAERISDASLAVLHPGDAVSHAVDLMLATDQGRIPVTDPKTGGLVGILTRKDLLQVRATVARAEGERRAYFRRKRPEPAFGRLPMAGPIFNMGTARAMSRP